MTAQLIHLPRPDAADFMALWSLWLGMRRGIGKKEALKAWQRAIHRAPAETIIAAAERYARSQAGKDPDYIPHCSTWLNQDRWEDQVEVAADRKAELQADFDQWCIDWVSKGRNLALRRSDADRFVKAKVSEGKIPAEMARKAGYDL